MQKLEPLEEALVREGVSRLVDSLERKLQSRISDTLKAAYRTELEFARKVLSKVS